MQLRNKDILAFDFAFASPQVIVPTRLKISGNQHSTLQQRENKTNTPTSVLPRNASMPDRFFAQIAIIVFRHENSPASGGWQSSQNNTILRVAKFVAHCVQS